MIGWGRVLGHTCFDEFVQDAQAALEGHGGDDEPLAVPGDDGGVEKAKSPVQCRRRAGAVPAPRQAPIWATNMKQPLATLGLRTYAGLGQHSSERRNWV